MQHYNIHYNFYTNNNILFDTYRSTKILLSEKIIFQYAI